MHALVVTVGWFTRKKISRRVRTRHSFAHGTTKLTNQNISIAKLDLSFVVFKQTEVCF